MNSSQISCWFVFATLVWFSWAQDSCRIYDEELGVNKNWTNCKDLCTQKNGSCLVWVYNDVTTRCVGWMVKGELQSKEKVKHYYNYRRRCEGSALKDRSKSRSKPKSKAKQEYTGDDDASASSRSQCGYSYDEEDDEDYVVDSYYDVFYNTPPETEAEEGDYDDPNMTTQDYYNAFYNIPTGNGGSQNEDDNGGTSSSTYDFAYVYGLAGSGSFDHDFGSSSSSSGHAASHGNGAGIAEPEIDDETRAAIKKRKHIERWTLYDQCHFIASPTLTASGNSVRNTTKGCLVLKWYLGEAVKRDDCLSLCQNPVKHSVNTSCIAWMWWSKAAACEGLFILAVDRNNICGLP